MIKFVKRLSYFFFCPEKFEQEMFKRIKDKSSDDAKNNLRDNFHRLREHVFRAGKLVLRSIAITLLISLVFLFFGVHFPHIFLVIMRIVGYCLILWGVLSHLGYSIKTRGGETLPEIFDEEWYKFSYLGGLSLLLLSYLLEIKL